MAGTKIRGITIELNAETEGISKALKGIDGELKDTQRQLKDVNKLLKLDPKNTELLKQKQEALAKSISLTKDRIEELKKAQSNVEKGSAEWNALEREIVDNEQKLKSLEKEYRSFGSVASQQIKAVGKSLQDSGKKIEGVGKKLSGISGGAAAIGGGLLKLGYDAVKSADEIKTLSQQTGLSTDELQKMQYASELVDVSVEDMTGALRKMKSKMSDSNEAFSSLGISVTDADGNLRDANVVFYEALEALSGIDNETERDQAAMELFGKSADSLAGIIDDGGKALKEYGQQAEDLGLILDGDTLDALNTTNDTIDSIKGNIAGTLAQIGADVGTVLAPIIEKAAELIGKITERLRELTPEQTETILKIVGVVAAIAPALIIIGKVVSGVGSIVSVIGTVVGVLGGPLTIAILAIVAIGILLYKNWDTIKEKATELKDKITEVWNNIKEKINEVIENVKSKIEGLKSKIDTLKQKFTDLKTKVSDVWNNIKDKLQEAIKLPHIPLPHFKVDPPGWKIGDLLKGTIPSLSIDWYAKAYDNPMMFTSPTVMATPYGYKGFGDGNGAEIVLGLEKLRELVGSQNQNVTVQVVLEGDARGIFKAVQKTNNLRTQATHYNALGGY